MTQEIMQTFIQPTSFPNWIWVLLNYALLFFIPMVILVSGIKVLIEFWFTVKLSAKNIEKEDNDTNSTSAPRFGT